MGVEGLINLVRGLASGVRGLVGRLLGRREPPPGI